MSRASILLFFSIALLSYSPAFAVEVAPRISDKEIIAGLSDIRGDIKRLEGRQDTLRADMNGLRAELKAEMNGLRAEMNARFDAVDKRFDDLHWMFRIFITIALVMLGFVLRLQWQMHEKQAQMETSLETHKDEISFLKSLIEKLLPSRGVL
jgi:hypothetical protein